MVIAPFITESNSITFQFKATEIKFHLHIFVINVCNITQLTSSKKQCMALETYLNCQKGKTNPQKGVTLMKWLHDLSLSFIYGSPVYLHGRGTSGKLHIYYVENSTIQQHCL
jgi:hypothetical protein